MGHSCSDFEKKEACLGIIHYHKHQSQGKIEMLMSSDNM